MTTTLRTAKIFQQRHEFADLATYPFAAGTSGILWWLGASGHWNHSEHRCARLPAGERFQECRVLAEQPEVSAWVIVDDQPGIVWGSQIPAPELARRVIWCDPVLGLATPLVATAIVKRFLDGDGH